MSVIAVTGLRSEARLAAAAGLRVVCAGGDPRRTATMLGAAVADDTTGLISFGIAGGLAPGLRRGDLVLADAVRSPDGARFAADPRWLAAARRAIAASGGDIWGGETIVGTVAAKAQLHAATGALAVDLESLVVARAAREFGLPFIALRAIADGSGRDLPRAALIPLSPAGTADLRRVLKDVLRHPEEIPGLIRIARETGIALGALGRASRTAAAVLRRDGCNSAARKVR